MSEEDFIAAFQAGTLDPFHHQDHVRMAWLYVRDKPILEAISTFTSDLQRYAIAFGQPNLYHETITWAFLFLIHERIGRILGQDWEAFAASNPDLMTWNPSVLSHYYRPETLQSELARRVFILPDVGREEG